MAQRAVGVSRDVSALTDRWHWCQSANCFTQNEGWRAAVSAQ